MSIFSPWRKGFLFANEVTQKTERSNKLVKDYNVKYNLFNSKSNELFKRVREEQIERKHNT